MRADGDVAEKAEAHRAVAQRVVARRTDGAKRARRSPVHHHIDRIEHAPKSCGRRIPGAFACYGVGIQLPATRSSDLVHAADVRAIVGEGDLLFRRVAPSESREFAPRVPDGPSRYRGGRNPRERGTRLSSADRSASPISNE